MWFWDTARRLRLQPLSPEGIPSRGRVLPPMRRGWEPVSMTNHCVETKEVGSTYLQWGRKNGKKSWKYGRRL